jgi:hypothetical protein
MFPARVARRQPIEYFMLLEPRADGPVLGIYAGRPIPAGVIDADGRHYRYVGAAPRLRSGAYDLAALGVDEWLVEPGLVYRGDREPSGWLSRLHWRRS